MNLAPGCRAPRPDVPRLGGVNWFILRGAAPFEWGFEGWAGTLAGTLGGAGGFMDGERITIWLLLGLTYGDAEGIWTSSEEAGVRLDERDDDCRWRFLTPCLMFLLICSIAAALRSRFSWSSCRWFTNSLTNLLFKLFGPGLAMIWLYWFSNAGSLGGGICAAISSPLSLRCESLEIATTDSVENRLSDEL